jgi:PAS domain S-box-containing protein
MQPTFTLAQKVMILVAVPLVFELVVVGGLAYLFNQAEKERLKEAHSIAITTHLNSLLRLLLERSFSHTLKSVSGSDEFGKVFKDAAIDMKKEFAELEELCKQNPVEYEMLTKLRKITHEANTNIKSARKALNEGDRITTMKNWLAVRQALKKISKLTDETIANQVSIQRKQAEEQASTRKGIESLLIAAGFGNVAIALILSMLFNKATTERLKSLMQNTVKLASDEPLNPPLRGGDEMATLDRFFRSMATALEESRKKERAVVDNVLDVICSIDADGRFSAVNPASMQIWGYSPEKLIGQRLVNIVPTDDWMEMKTTIAKIVDERSSGNVDSRVRCNDGSVREMQWTVQWSPEEQALFCVAHDVTERKDLERIKREFVAMVSHDLKTPLTAIQMVHSLLESEAYGTLNEDGHESLQIAEENVSRLMKLVNDLLDIERIESGEMELDLAQTSVNKVVNSSVDVVRAIADKENITIKVDGLETDQTIIVDGDRLIQVLVNLLSNAIKFSKPSQTVAVKVTESDRYFEFSVIDSGRGIPAELKAVVFERFKQTNATEDRKKGGTGLGLAIAKAIVERHCGQIGVESALDEGSRFWFRLPKNVAS